MQNVIDIKQAKSIKTQWSTIIGVTVFHAMAVAAFFTFSWQNLAVAVLFWWIANSVGIGIQDAAAAWAVIDAARAQGVGS